MGFSVDKINCLELTGSCNKWRKWCNQTMVYFLGKLVKLMENYNKLSHCTVTLKFIVRSYQKYVTVIHTGGNNMNER